MANPARRRVSETLRTLIATTTELPLLSTEGAERSEFEELGLTDAMILHLCMMHINGISPTLITADGKLADRANSLGYGVIDYTREFGADRDA